MTAAQPDPGTKAEARVRMAGSGAYAVEGYALVPAPPPEGITQANLAGAKLVLVVHQDGSYQLSSPLSRERAADVLAGIAEDIQMGDPRA